MRVRIIVALLLSLSWQPGYGEDSLCTEKESIVFSCHIEKKTVSLCRSANDPKSLTYRFGGKDHIELTYPGPKDKSRFYLTEQPVYGGGITSLAFARGDYEYRLYSKIGREESEAEPGERVPLFEDGLVVSKSGIEIKQMICDDGGEGFREDISWLSARSVK
ncbi:MAG: hypothetical protein ACU836_06765 [Gammaproteobacteria bacterium]